MSLFLLTTNFIIFITKYVSFASVENMRCGINYNLIWLSLAIFYFCEGTYINNDVERTTDMRSHLVKSSLKINTRQIGDTKEPYLFSVPLDECKNLVFISAKGPNDHELQMKKRNTTEFCDFLIDLNGAAGLYVETVFSGLLIPHPKEILQSDKQLVKFIGNSYFFSKYKTKNQKTVIKLSSQNIVHHSIPKPFSVFDKTITLGPYENVEESSVSLYEIHFENHTPFLTVKSLERTIEISHWGNIAIEEKISLVHSGAKLKGPFSRYELQKEAHMEHSAIKSYKTLLPAAATSVYYRDNNGNISTSDMKVTPDAVELEIRPRFSLLGGWKFNYILGYNVPSFEYLFNHNQNFSLKMRVIDHIYDDMIINEAIVKIILPEGSKDIELVPPFPVRHLSSKISHTYLDTTGRPVISFSKENLVENHISDFVLRYTFSKALMIQEPILVVASIFSFFIVIILFKRLDFSISIPENHKNE